MRPLNISSSHFSKRMLGPMGAVANYNVAFVLAAIDATYSSYLCRIVTIVVCEFNRCVNFSTEHAVCFKMCGALC